MLQNCAFKYIQKDMNSDRKTLIIMTAGYFRFCDTTTYSLLPLFIRGVNHPIEGNDMQATIAIITYDIFIKGNDKYYRYTLSSHQLSQSEIKEQG